MHFICRSLSLKPDTPLIDLKGGISAIRRPDKKKYRFPSLESTQSFFEYSNSNDPYFLQGHFISLRSMGIIKSGSQSY
jgi:hypothetical protein